MDKLNKIVEDYDSKLTNIFSETKSNYNQITLDGCTAQITSNINSEESMIKDLQEQATKEYMDEIFDEYDYSECPYTSDDFMFGTGRSQKDQYNYQLLALSYVIKQNASCDVCTKYGNSVLNINNAPDSTLVRLSVIKVGTVNDNLINSCVETYKEISKEKYTKLLKEREDIVVPFGYASRLVNLLAKNGYKAYLLPIMKNNDIADALDAEGKKHEENYKWAVKDYNLKSSARIDSNKKISTAILFVSFIALYFILYFVLKIIFKAVEDFDYTFVTYAKATITRGIVCVPLAFAFIIFAALRIKQTISKKKATKKFNEVTQKHNVVFDNFLTNANYDIYVKLIPQFEELNKKYIQRKKLAYEAVVYLKQKYDKVNSCYEKQIKFLPANIRNNARLFNKVFTLMADGTVIDFRQAVLQATQMIENEDDRAATRRLQEQRYNEERNHRAQMAESQKRAEEYAKQQAEYAQQQAEYAQAIKESQERTEKYSQEQAEYAKKQAEYEKEQARLASEADWRDRQRFDHGN